MQQIHQKAELVSDLFIPVNAVNNIVQAKFQSLHYYRYTGGRTLRE